MAPTFGGRTSGTLKLSSSLTLSLLRPDETLIDDSEGAVVIGEGVASSTSNRMLVYGINTTSGLVDLLAAGLMPISRS